MADLPVGPAEIKGELLGLIPRMRLLPGEDQGSFDDLRQALLLDLAPSTPYEIALSENLVILQWEAVRYRRLRDDLVLERFRELAVGVFEEGRIQMTVSTSPQARELANGLAGQDKLARQHALEALAQTQISEGAILAKAYDAESKTLALLEKQIAELEDRRRKLRSEFDQVKVTRATSVSDAEIVEDDDF